MKIGKILGLAALAGGGFAAFKTTSKMNELKATYDQVIAFSGEEKDYDEFDGASIAVMFAGLEVDLTNATMVGDTATLKLYGEYCGIDVKVPSEWNVKVTGVDERAGVDNSVVYDGNDATSKLLLIDYEVKYSGLQIREGKSATIDGFDVEEASEDDLEEMPDPYNEVEVEEAVDLETEF